MNEWFRGVREVSNRVEPGGKVKKEGAMEEETDCLWDGPEYCHQAIKPWWYDQSIQSQRPKTIIWSQKM